MNKIIKNSDVIILKGKDKGKTGTVTSVKGDKVFIDGINLSKKHQKPNPNLEVEGGIVEKSMPVSVSNVSLYVRETKRPSRTRVVYNNDVKSREVVKK